MKYLEEKVQVVSDEDLKQFESAVIEQSFTGTSLNGERKIKDDEEGE